MSIIVVEDYCLKTSDGAPVSQCQNEATCVPKFKDYECRCQPGYEGRYCEKSEIFSPSLPMPVFFIYFRSDILSPGVVFVFNMTDFLSSKILQEIIVYIGPY